MKVRAIYSYSNWEVGGQECFGTGPDDNAWVCHMSICLIVLVVGILCKSTSCLVN